MDSSRSESSDVDEKWWETQSKDTALSVSLFKVVCGWATQQKAQLIAEPNPSQNLAGDCIKPWECHQVVLP